MGGLAGVDTGGLRGYLGVVAGITEGHGEKQKEGHGEERMDRGAVL